MLDIHSAFEKCRQTLKIEYADILYPQMKLLDMGFWQLGLDAEEQAKNRNKLSTTK